VRVLHGTLPADGRRWLTLLDPARTRAMLLLALATASAAVSALLFPPPLAVLFCLLLGAACVLPLRLPHPHSLAAGPAAAIALCAGRAVATGLALDPGAAAASVLGATSLGILLLEVSSLAGLWTARALERTSMARPGGAGRTGPGVLDEPAILRWEAGQARIEWELARAADYRRPVTLCLLGVDPRPDQLPGALDPSELEGRMRRVDHLLLRELHRFETAAEHGAGERLLVLPELWADGCAEMASELCARAAGRAGRTVRAALVTFPFDGTRSETLLADLGSGLEHCRAGEALVRIGALERGAASVADFAS
jgi:hypothetical protein